MKLSQQTKSDILAVVIKNVFAKREAALAAREDKLANIVYGLQYSQDIRAKMNALPDTFFTQRSEVWVEHGQYSDGMPLRMTSSKKVSAADRDAWRAPLVRLKETKGTEYLEEAIMIFIADRDKLQEDMSMLKKKINTLLSGVNTDTQLLEQWPEGEIYYKHALPLRPTKNLPAIQGKEITETINKVK